MTSRSGILPRSYVISKQLHVPSCQISNSNLGYFTSRRFVAFQNGLISPDLDFSTTRECFFQSAVCAETCIRRPYIRWTVLANSSSARKHPISTQTFWLVLTLVKFIQTSSSRKSIKLVAKKTWSTSLPLLGIVFSLLVPSYFGPKK